MKAQRERPQELVGRVEALHPLVLEAQRRLQRPVALRVVDRESDLVGHERQEGDFFRVVGVRLAAPHDQHAAPAARGRQRQRTRRPDRLSSQVLHLLPEAAFPVDDRNDERLLMLDDPVGQLLFTGQVRRFRALSRLFEHAGLDDARPFVVERETKEAEADNGAKLARETAEQGVAVVIGAQRLGHADERLVAFSEGSSGGSAVTVAHRTAVYRPVLWAASSTADAREGQEVTCSPLCGFAVAAGTATASGARTAENEGRYMSSLHVEPAPLTAPM